MLVIVVMLVAGTITAVVTAYSGPMPEILTSSSPTD
jgi:hypothetical protein